LVRGPSSRKTHDHVCFDKDNEEDASGIKQVIQMKAVDITKKLRSLGSPEVAKSSAWFFKTGPG
jgi:hypothetical protein